MRNTWFVSLIALMTLACNSPSPVTPTSASVAPTTAAVTDTPAPVADVPPLPVAPVAPPVAAVPPPAAPLPPAPPIRTGVHVNAPTTGNFSIHNDTDEGATFTAELHSVDCSRTAGQPWAREVQFIKAGATGRFSLNAHPEACGLGQIDIGRNRPVNCETPDFSGGRTYQMPVEVCAPPPPACSEPTFTEWAPAVPVVPSNRTMGLRCIETRTRTDCDGTVTVETRNVCQG